jgi:bifunctional non-homologous end joining protein LigD
MKKLATYAAKRDFAMTSEPPARVGKGEGHSFVVQKHAARRLHYDFRLELDGVLKSWAVPKGPSLSSGEKRLAVEVEDHPIDYRDFEGTIPKGEYGGGEVIVWDRGRWAPVGDPHEGLRKGHLRFVLEGEKLGGGFSLVRLKGRDREKRTNWLLLKSHDEYEKEGKEAEITERAPSSVLTGRTLKELASASTPPPPGMKDRKGRLRAATKKKTTTSPKAVLAQFEPQLATLVDRVPEAAGWLFEMKFDGYRALAIVDQGDVRLVSRNGLDWGDRFTAIAEALRHIRVKNAVLDGEICFLDDDGKTSFQRLQNALSEKDQSCLAYIVFDILYRDGEDLRERPLLERKKILATILAGERLPLKLSEHVEDSGTTIYEEACRMDLEGVMAKRADAPYRSGRTRTWLKIKCGKRQEFVIIGYTAPKGSRTGLGALVLAVREQRKKGALRFAGKVGTGFSAKSIASIHRKLERLARATPPVPDAPRMRDVTWVEPEVVCEVRFTEWTNDGALRHPAFLGLREDKPATEVVREREEHVPTRKIARTAARLSQRAQPAPMPKAARKPSRARPDAPKKERTPRAPSRTRPEAEPVVVRGVTITHADREVDEASGVTKGELARYYGAVADAILVYAKSRPLALVRCPSGQGKKCFFQKHAMPGMGDLIRRATVGEHEVIYISKAAGILELAQFGVIELHGWGSRLPAADKPNWIVLDLDPDEALPYGRVVEAALEAREVLRSIGLASWVKTTGGKGLHVVAPVRPRHGWDVVKRLARAVAEDFVRRSPDAFTATPSKAARRGKIFVDHLRNGEGATAVLPYSARARENVTVAMPIAWEDLRRVHPKDFTVRTAPGLVARRRRDPWALLLETKQSLPHDLDELLAKAKVGQRA